MYTMNRIFIIALTAAIPMLFCGLSAQQRVVLDNFYNNEFHAKTGKPYHYLWEDTQMSGFSEFGKLFVEKGAVLSTLKEKPTRKNLKNAAVYIIVDPDDEKETASPNFMDVDGAKTIANWVKRGGVLLILSNDYNHAETEKFNLLMAQFGMQFGKEMLHPEKSVKGQPRNFNSCASVNLPNHPLFMGVGKIFLKEIAPINCRKPALPILVEEGQPLIAEASFGKGYVMAIGDPWFYNEYIGHLLLPEDFENTKAATNMVGLLLNKTRNK
jgi:hypothetical protein